VTSILLVDDEPDILESFRAVVEASLPGTEVLTALSGRDGLAVLAMRKVDLILSDFKMPGMDGIEFLVRAGKLHPTVPRAMYTAFADDELRRRAIAEAGVDAFMSKSLDLAGLVARVKALLVRA
jgi:response regulator RpfG family c-di-GMP phosphodiesterase